MDTIEELTKQIAELDNKIELHNKEIEELYDEQHELDNKRLKLQDKLLELQSKGINIKENEYLIFKQEPSWHYSIFDSIKITNVTNKLIKYIEYIFRYDDGDLCFKVQECKIPYKNFLKEFYSYRVVSSTDAEKYIIEGSNLKHKENE